MLLAEVVETSNAVAATSARGDKIERLAACVRRLEPTTEAAIGVAYLSGQLRRQIGVGYASLRDAPPAAATASLSLVEVDAALDRVGRQAGKDSQAQRRRLLNHLLSNATRGEQ